MFLSHFPIILTSILRSLLFSPLVLVPQIRAKLVKFVSSLCSLGLLLLNPIPLLVSSDLCVLRACPPTCPAVALAEAEAPRRSEDSLRQNFPSFRVVQSASHFAIFAFFRGHHPRPWCQPPLSKRIKSPPITCPTDH